MPDLVQEKLHSILMDHGRRVMDDPVRLEALLRDYCGERRGEVSALLGALREGVPAALGSGPVSVPREALVATLTRRLQENQGLTDDLARWAVATWAFALGLGEPRPAAFTAPTERTALEQPSATPAPVPRLNRSWANWAIAGIALVGVGGLWFAAQSGPRVPTCWGSWRTECAEAAKRLEAISATANANGYRLVAAGSGTLGAPNSEWLTVKLEQGQKHHVVGSCDTLCRNLYLSLTDTSMTQVVSDKQGYLPLITLVPPATQPYRLHIKMGICRSDLCWYDVRVYRE